MSLCDNWKKFIYSFYSNYKRFFIENKLIATLISLAAFKGVFDLGRLIYFYIIHKPINWDTLIYLTIGRGILNGIKPYSGLYEMKPPGIFLISALSLRVTGNETFGIYMQIAFQVLIPLLISWAAWKITIKKPSSFRIFSVMSGMVFGLIVSLYAESRHIAFQSEGFGFFFALLYVISIAFIGRMTILRTVIASVGILGCIGMKEPFFLSVIAVALILQDEDESFFKNILYRLVFPFLIAAVSGIIIMALLGYLDGYLGIHLPFIFESRVSNGLPLPLRGLSIGYVLMDLFITPMFLFGLPVGLFILITLVGSKIPVTYIKRLIVSFFGCIIFSTVLWFVIRNHQLVGRLEWNNINIVYMTLRKILLVGEAWTAWKIILVGLLILASIKSFLAIPRKHFTQTLIIIFALYLVSLAAAAGNFFGSHMIFALPLYCAFFFMFLHRINKYTNPRFLQNICAILLFMAAIFTYQKNHQYILQQEIQYNEKSNTELTEAFDSIMESCDIKRYFIVGDGAFLTSHSKYSPIGPIPFHLPFMSDSHSLLVDYYKRGLAYAQFAILMPEGRNIHVLAKLLEESNFTRSIPKCAKPNRLPENYVLYFRDL
ncbi:hypothetical protein HOD71_03625 [Candidatus Peribacteria bacterium]|nr:hypothetical protein [Candidatus Peribacteria bacterium]MBT4474603.1 hypothetical protein [Candidatus Peribacteria bacterium]